MSKIKVGSAENHILAKAEHIDRLEFRYLYLQEETRADILGWYRERQNPDGGFPAIPERVGFDTEHCSCISMTLRNLRNLFLLGFGQDSVTEQAVEFLFAHQEDDGSFSEVSAVSSYDVPEWAVSGSDDVALWHTTAVLYSALQTRYGEAPEVVKGFEFLHRKWTLTDGLVSRFYFPQIYGFGAYAIRDGTDDDRFEKCLSNIIKGWGRLPMWEMPHILEICHTVGLPSEHPLALKAITRLRVSQNPLGYWIDGFSQLGSPQNTIFALLALKSFGQI